MLSNVHEIRLGDKGGCESKVRTPHRALCGLCGLVARLRRETLT